MQTWIKKLVNFTYKISYVMKIVNLCAKHYILNIVSHERIVCVKYQGTGSKDGWMDGWVGGWVVKPGKGLPTAIKN